jgi:hypothetical protein
VSELRERLQAALGRAYRIERELGGGGMSRVFLAEDTSLGRKVVVKVLPPEMAAGVNIERFRREIQLAASLQHPHIVPLHAAGQAGDLFYYTMPLVEGESLRVKLTREGELPVPEVARVLKDVADALAYAHKHGVVHRDIKPDNILISGHHAVVTDFGVAKAVSEATGASSLTSIGVALGTPAYMAPEQAAADPHADHRADIYALGALGYEMLTGRPPFTGSSPQMVLAAQVTQAPEPVTQHRAAVPPALAELVMRCLEKKPADRWQSADDLLHTLEAIATPSGGMTPTSTAPYVASAAGTKRTSRLAGYALVTAVALAAAAAIIFWPRAASGKIDPNVVAVAPFRVGGADPSLAYLREGMLDLLAAKLTGEAGLRTADPRTVLTAWQRAAGAQSGDLSEEEAVRLAQRIGAGHLLLGSVVGNPARVVLSATLHAVPTGRTSAQATVEGPSDSLPVLVDRLAGQLLASQAGVASNRLASLAGTSLPALRAYLDGQADYRRGRYVEAAQRFERALELDSSFAPAGSGLSAAFAWLQTADSAARRGLRRAWSIRGRLSERDRVVAEAYGAEFGLTGPTSYGEVLPGWERASAVAPDRADAQFELGDVYFHYGPALGIADAMQRAAGAFGRALELDSAFAGPLGHLLEISTQQGDTARARLLGRLFLAVDSTSDVAEYIRWRLAVALHDSVGMRAFRNAMNRTGLQSLARVLGAMQVEGIGLEDERVVAAAVSLLVPAAEAADREGLTPMQAAYSLNAGHPADGLAVYQAGGFSRPIRLAAIHVWLAMFWDGDSASAARAELQLASLADAPVARETARRADQYQDVCVVEGWRLAHGQTGTAVRGIGRLRSARIPADSAGTVAEAGICAALLEAQLATIQRRADARTAVERLDSIARSVPQSSPMFPQCLNVVAASLYEALGDVPHALTATRRRVNHWNDGVFCLSTLLREEGRLAALTGDPDGAIRAYRHYLALRPSPEPALAPRVAQARAELARLQGGAARP